MKPLTAVRDWRLVHGGAVVLVLALFLWELTSVLSPIVLFFALLVLLAPYSGSPFHRLLVAMSAVLVGLWLLADLGTLLAPFILGLGLAYVLDPLVDQLERARLPRSLAILILTLPALLALGLLLFMGIPALAEQIQSLILRTPELVERLAEWLEGLQAGILGLDLPFVDEEDIARRLRELSPTAVTDFLQEKQRAVATAAWEGVLGLGRGLGTVFTIVGYVLLTPVLTFYLLRDWDAIVERIGSYVPRSRYEGWAGFAREYDRLLSRYLRGQVLAATVVGILTWLGLWIAGFPYSGLVGAVAGVFNLVPYLGLVVSLVPALIIAVLSGTFLASIAKVAVVFLIVQFLDGNIIGPRIVGESVGLHPVWVILAIAVGGFFLGFVGLLLALPGAILVKLLLEAGLERYRASAVYLGE
jgi:predicted PurR-regulated permease PerM